MPDRRRHPLLPQVTPEELRSPEWNDDPFPDTDPTEVLRKCDSWSDHVERWGHRVPDLSASSDVDRFNVELRIEALSDELGRIAELWRIESGPLFQFGYEPAASLIQKARGVVNHVRARALKKWQEANERNHHISLDAWLTCPDLAKSFEVDKEKLRKRLETFRKKNFDVGWREVANAGCRKARYTYHVEAVAGILKKMGASVGASAERPSEKSSPPKSGRRR